MIKHGTIIAILGFSLSLSSNAPAQSRYAQPTQRLEKYSLTEGEPIPIPARKTKLPVVVYGDNAPQKPAFVPSGFMGDSRALKISSFRDSAPVITEKNPEGKRGKNSLKITYNATGNDGWAGVYWLAPANNWGTVKGGGLNLSQAQRLTFWMRGERGGEVITDVKVGGISTGSYPDTDVASIGPIKLSTDWEQYAIDLKDKDLRHIIGGFVFIVRKVDNVRGAQFYLDEIVYDNGAIPLSAPVAAVPAETEAPAAPEVMAPANSAVTAAPIASPAVETAAPAVENNAPVAVP